MRRKFSALSSIGLAIGLVLGAVALAPPSQAQSFNVDCSTSFNTSETTVPGETTSITMTGCTDIEVLTNPAAVTVTHNGVDVTDGTKTPVNSNGDTLTVVINAAAPPNEAVAIFFDPNFGTFQMTVTSAPAPTVTSVSPTSGSDAGGTSVTITGTDFTGATAVTFGGTAASSFSFVSATQITAVTPAGTAGAVDVAVTTPGGTATDVGAFTYTAPAPTPAPTVSSVSPTSGPVAGGTSVTITGTDFTGATAVTFGGTAATSVTVVSATQMTAVTPTGTAGPVDVAVTTPGGTATDVGAFTYTAPTPALTPVFGTATSTVGGFTVDITNYDSDYDFTVAFSGQIPPATIAAVTLGTPSGSTLPITVTGLNPGDSATIEVTTELKTDATVTASQTTIGSAIPEFGSISSGNGTAMVQWSGFPTATNYALIRLYDPSDPNLFFTVPVSNTNTDSGTFIISEGIATLTSTLPAGTYDIVLLDWQRNPTVTPYPEVARENGVNIAAPPNPGPNPPAPAPAPVFPPSAPGTAQAQAGNGEVTVSWEAPASQGSFPVTNYQVQSTPGSHGCLVPATATSCQIAGLDNGTPYTFKVRALNGGGWGSWADAGTVTPAPTPDPDASIMVTGSRSGNERVARVTGQSTGLNGVSLQSMVRLSTRTEFASGRAVQPEGTGDFTWKRRVSPSVGVEVYFTAGDVTSNTVTIASNR
jgi:large repetitive protein